MSPDPDDPLRRQIHTLDEAKHLVLEYAMGLHKVRRYNGVPREARLEDVVAHRKDPPKPMDYALKKIRREVLHTRISVGWSRSVAHVVLFHKSGAPMPAETFTDGQLQEFCLRVLELCAAWEGVDQHLDR